MFLAFIGAKRRALTGEAGSPGAGFQNEGQMGLCFLAFFVIGVVFGKGKVRTEAVRGRKTLAARTQLEIFCARADEALAKKFLR
jgi:hypothetical protein